MLAQETTTFGEFVPAIGVFVAAIVAVIIVRSIVRQRGDDAPPESRWKIQAWTFAIGGVGLLGVLLTLPSGGLDKQTILSVLGLALTAVIALSASTIVANAMAGLMLHSVGNYRPGDFIRVATHFGRVTERGLFHTELQTEDGDLTTLPNSLLVNNAVTVIRSSGTVVSCSVSLGYDVARTRIEDALLRAAAAIGLEEPFVHITDLGDFAVTYRIAGFLKEVKQVLRTRSRLRASVLDALHVEGVEIVSPNFMNQRILDPDMQFIPRRAPGGDRQEPPTDEVPQELVFDKAERAGRLEELRDQRRDLAVEIGELEAQLKAGDGDEAKVERRREAAQRMVDHVEYLIEALQSENPN